MILSPGDQLKERIRFNTESIKMYFLLLITNVSALISLISDGVHSRLEIILASGAAMTAFAATVILTIQYRKTTKLINHGTAQ